MNMNFIKQLQAQMKEINAEISINAYEIQIQHFSLKPFLELGNPSEYSGEHQESTGYYHYEITVDGIRHVICKELSLKEMYQQLEEEERKALKLAEEEIEYVDNNHIDKTTGEVII